MTSNAGGDAAVGWEAVVSINDQMAAAMRIKRKSERLGIKVSLWSLPYESPTSRDRRNPVVTVEAR
jgi:hypothetical protein